jgi:flagellar biosynthetic protein FlhB
VADDTEKTEPATPERRKKAREEGQFPRAKDAGATVGTIAVLVCLAGMGSTMVETLHSLCLTAFGQPENFMRGDLRALGIPILGALVKLMLPTAAAAMVVGTAVGFAEAGYNPRMELLEPKWERLNPITKLQQLFSPSQMLVNTALQIGRV